MYNIKGVVFVMMCLFFSPFLPAQKSLSGLLDAEKSFAAYTKSHTIREGFLAFMDSTGLVFKNGKAILAIGYYQNQPLNKAILSWKPDFAVISSSGHLGVTAGPYELRAEKLSDKPVARGHFSSVWKMNVKGEWKNILDLGTEYPVGFVQGNSLFAKTLDKRNRATAAFDQVRMADSILNEALSHQDAPTIESYLTVETRLQQNGQLPITGIQKIVQRLLAMPSGTTLQYLGGGNSHEGDLVYTYGVTSLDNRQGNYLRAWVLQKKVWKLVLQTIR
ncbi:MAG: hypothetical protein KGO92_02685 [Bacteroidota bacterium]|nr:hypothetical protein [Bacteroidota bacterium]